MTGIDFAALKDAFGPGLAFLLLILALLAPTLVQRIGRDKQTNAPATPWQPELQDAIEEIEELKDAVKDHERRLSSLERHRDTEAAIARFFDGRTIPPR